MKIPNTLATAAAVVAMTFASAGAALAQPGVGDGGMGSHYPPVHMGVGDGGTGSATLAAKKVAVKATGHVARISSVYNRAGRAVKTDYVFKDVVATRITVTTLSCKGKVLKRQSREAWPVAAGGARYKYSVRTPKGAAMSRVKFSAPKQARATVQTFHLSSCS